MKDSVLSPQSSVLNAPQSFLAKVTLVRHGETVGESSVRYHGVTDVGLSEVGRQQMERVARALAGEEFDAVYASTLSRSLASARIIAPRREPQALRGFDEINFGRWEGLTREEIEARDPDLFHRWRASMEEFTYPDGDCVRDFRARVVETWRDLLGRAPQRVLVVAHRGVIATIVAETLGIGAAAVRPWRIGLGSIHVLARHRDAWRVEVADRHDHLEA